MINYFTYSGFCFIVFSLCFGFLFYSFLNKYCKRTTHQQEDIYNISSRVQDQWPTHDAHLSIDHISILNQMNKSMYNDAPPSYDEVMKTAIQTNGEASTPTAVIVEAPKAISTTTSLRQQ
ncbi:unnamed protein product [Psylliodes chrysocephalus]|uniref:Uncharacterized protein n=1 Tax=Psylliodes chrysocephalus TaxID=3402493 RepID=A0A9P0G8N2_9CUCU|nr:unnamed protein product [Psylliodes chrysocephala]